MGAKLIKTKVGYHLWLNPETKEQQHIASDCEIVSDNGADLRKYKLSLKNCQEIERGYDLDELVKSECKNSSYNDLNHLVERGFKEGFKKALEINDGKLFTIPQVIKLCTDYYKIGAIEVGMPKDRRAILPREIIEDIKRLQQTEWDVEIVGSGTVYKTVLDCCTNYHPKFGCSKKDDCSCKNNEIPKLDANNCLILKRKV